ncbi:hypothetical protein NDQ72_01370 [Halomonas sp. KG2]|uniref:hypothetical protein n=1 Tax=Halomonas sp. KG2 TaxID=2951138 RepID=UPI00264A44AE|nr:hypothetical protein [Halomonas sp. KG2]WKD28624.1 hypothetical protein NDQ72_01370 [Halomonas sp. KG2]
MEIIRANYKGFDHFAKAENEVQQRYAVDAIKKLEAQVAEEVRRIETSFYDLEYLDARVYQEARLKGLKTLRYRLSNAWAEVAGMFDDEADS